MSGAPTTGDVKGPPGTGPMGHQAAYARDPLRALNGWAAKFGDVVRLRFGPQRVLLLTSPAAAVEVLDRQADAFRKAPVIAQLAVPVVGHSLFTAEGDSWRRQRALIGPAMAAAEVDPHILEMAAAFAELMESWQAGLEVEATDAMMAVSQRIGWRLLFGAEATDEIVATVREVLEVTSSDFELRLAHPLMLLVPNWVPTPAHRRLFAAVRRLDEIAYDLIARGRDGRIGGGSVLGPLIAAQSTEHWLTDRLIRDNLVNLIVDSRENPGLLLAWALYELTRKPDLMERAGAEAYAATTPRLSPDTLANQALLGSIVRETLRLHPPAYAFGRQAVRDCVVAGVHVARGTVVLVSPFVTHRRETDLEAPGTFQPDRSMEGRTDDVHAGEYFPFGLGERRCPGEHLAEMIGLVGLATLLANHRFEAVDPAPIEPYVRLSLRPAREVRLRVLPQRRIGQ